MNTKNQLMKNINTLDGYLTEGDDYAANKAKSVVMQQFMNCYEY